MEKELEMKKEEELSCFNLLLLIYIAHYNLECPA